MHSTFPAAAASDATASNLAAAPHALAECGPVDAEKFTRDIAGRSDPIVLRGQVADWPAVGAAHAGVSSIASYIAEFDRGEPASVMIGPPDIGGRFFYSDDMAGFNFKREKVQLRVLARELERLSDVARPHALYAGAAAAHDHLPGWTQANPMVLPVPDPTPRVWIGNATQISTHYDAAPNLACVAAGVRRFTLFPPDQIANLYVGPIDITLAGQPVSMVDPDAPDLVRFPRYADAMATARSAELQPGDAIFIPAMWWHNVRATAPFNVLVNYWFGRGLSPFPALIHALMSVRDLPPAERRAWRQWFDHYVFDDTAADAGAHIEPVARGVLGPASDERTDRIIDYLMQMLSRC